MSWGLSGHETFRRAYRHLERATASPRALGLSIRALMHVHNGRHAEALADAGRAVELEPKYPIGHQVLAQAASLAGRLPQAPEHVARAMRLDPRYPASHAWTAGLAHFIAGEYERAREWFERAGVDQAGFDLAPVLATRALLGDLEDARALAELQRERWRQWHPGHPMTVRALVAAFPPLLRKEDEDRLRLGLERALATLAEPPAAPG